MATALPSRRSRTQSSRRLPTPPSRPSPSPHYCSGDDSDLAMTGSRWGGCGNLIRMGFFETASLLITLAAFFSFVNCKYIRLPATIGVMFMSLATSVLIIALGSVAKPIRDQAARIVGGIDFHQALL